MKIKVNKKQVIETDGKSTVKKAVKNVKQILEKKSAIKKILEKESESKPIVNKIKKRKWINRPQTERHRGIVYVGHIPHGFYEPQMEEYFKQFGSVTRVRLSRSKQTGKSRGYGYVEFKDPDVAKIAAETMNNYLMFGRLVKATYIPPENQHEGFFSKYHWTSCHYPRKMNRIKENRILNGTETKEEHKIFVKKSIKRLNKLSKKFSDQGIDLGLKVRSQKI